MLLGHFLTRNTEYDNSGEGYMRTTLVADIDTCAKAAGTIVAFYQE